MRTTKFKPSEIGPIPTEWEVKRLGELGTFKNGISKGADSFGHGVPFVNLVDVFGKSRLTSAEGLGLVEASHAEIADSGLKQGDTLFVRSSVKLEGVGLATVIDGELPNTVFSGFLLRYRDNELEVGYKRYAFSEAKFRRRVIAVSTVSANTNVNQTALKGLFVPVPPLPEQRRIATALSDTDAWIESLDKLIEKKKLVKQGTMQALLSGKSRLPGFVASEFKSTGIGPIPQDWKVTQLGEIMHSFRTGPFGSSLHASDYVRNGTPIINPMHIIDGKICPSEEMSVAMATVCRLSEYRLQRDDLIIGRRGEMGRVALVTPEEEGWLCGTGCFFVHFKDVVHPAYIALYLRTPQCVRHLSGEAVGTTLINLNKAILDKVLLPLPPLAEQRAIAEVLSDMDAELAALSREKAKAEQIKQGMMQELLTGRVRLAEESSE